jgi:phosphatidate phosphatase PAH1
LQPDGSMKASPFHVRFGKNIGLLSTKDKLVEIIINGNNTGVLMKLGTSGEGYFVQKTYVSTLVSSIIKIKMKSPVGTNKTD